MVNSEQSKTDIEIVESPQLTYDEERDRLILEREVERAFYKAGCALKELRDRKLYKSTHSSFEQYCEDRFGMRRRHPYRLIDAATVVDNILQLCPNRTQNDSDTEKNIAIIPTSEWQIRSLTKLEPQQQREVWIKAVELAGNKAPSGRVVSELASEIKPKQNTVSVKLTIGHRIIVSRTHPLFPNRSGIISQIPNKKDAVVELDNGKTELISQDYLELELNSSIKELPPEGIAYTQGVGIEYNVRLSQETWEKLNEYAARVGTATLDGAIALLLEQGH
ncbi:MAG: hypothetical protein QNJ72_39445, partial [Pleurocapsa sp. MO_226.B13]|nr:hypothetical protein [Pleurocapsa sp. MO_226.B13]